MSRYTYAQRTTVSAEKSRAEIERILGRYGADCFGYLTSPDHTQVAFRAHGKNLRFVVHMPDKAHFRYIQGWEQACRQRWRALALVIKAKLEAVESGVALFEHEFMAHIVLPSGETVGEWLGPQLAQVYATQTMPPLLALPPPPRRERA